MAAQMKSPTASNLPDRDAPSNPYQATALSNLVTAAQLQRLSVAAESAGMSKEETALALFGCPVNALSRAAAEQLLAHFARVKQNFI